MKAMARAAQAGGEKKIHFFNFHKAACSVAVTGQIVRSKTLWLSLSAPLCLCVLIGSKTDGRKEGSVQKGGTREKNSKRHPKKNSAGKVVVFVLPLSFWLT